MLTLKDARRAILDVLVEHRWGQSTLYRKARERVSGWPNSREVLAEALAELQEEGSVSHSPKGVYYIPRHPYPKDFTIQARRATRIDGQHRCDECGAVTTPVWLYGKSSLGRPVHLCGGCQGAVYERSYGYKDAFDTGLVETSGFETDRGRH